MLLSNTAEDNNIRQEQSTSVSGRTVLSPVTEVISTNETFDAGAYVWHALVLPHHLDLVAGSIPVSKVSCVRGANVDSCPPKPIEHSGIMS